MLKLIHFKRFKTYELYQNIFQKLLSIDFFILMILQLYQSLLSYKNSINILKYLYKYMYNKI